MAIRVEESSDWPAIFSIYAAAFRQSAEADLVQRMDADGDLLLSLMAYTEEPVGHIAFTRLDLDEDPSIRGCVLAPLAVVPAYRKQGIGTLLIENGLRHMSKGGLDLVVALGKPDYYGRFGFTSVLARKLKTPYDGPNLQALALSERGRSAHGPVSYARAFAELT
jgi:putative acetyltransferase